MPQIGEASEQLRPDTMDLKPGPIVGMEYVRTSAVDDPQQENKRIYTFDSECSPTRYVAFWDPSVGENGQYVMDVRFVGGGVARLHHFMNGQENGGYRPVWVRDPWDNETRYFYDSTSHRPIRVEHPDGVHQEYTYTAGGNGELWVAITYKKNGVPDASLSWGYKIDNLGRTEYVWSPKTPMLIGPGGPGSLPGSNALYATPAVGTQPTYRWRIEKYEYVQMTGLQDWLPSKVYEDFTTQTTTVDGKTFPVPSASPTKIAEWQYALSDGVGHNFSRHRVITFIDRDGGNHNFEYQEAVTQTMGLPYVQKTVWIDPRGTRREYIRDENLRVTSLKVTPTNDPQGRPRAFDSSQYPEPVTLTWLYEYASCNCSCELPTKITELPSGRVTENTWDTNTGRLLSTTGPSPTGSGTATWTYEYTDSWYDSTQQQALMKKVTGPDGRTWEYIHVFVDRLDSRHGKKLLLSQLKSPQVTGPSGTYNILVTSVFDSKGRIVSVSDPENPSVATQFDYGTGWYLLTNTEGVGGSAGTKVTRYNYDDYGRLLWVKGNEGSTGEILTTFVRGPLGEMLDASTQRGAVVQRTVVYYDVWGNPAVVFRQNKNSAGGAQTDHVQGSSSARAWTRNEFHYLGDLLIREFQDRRPLYDPADSSPVSGTNPWMNRWTFTYLPDGDLHTIESPNGTIRTLTKDGYGTLYKAVDTHGAQSNEVARFYIDNELEVVRVATSVGETVLERNAASYVKAVVEPELASAPQGYGPGSLGGARHEYAYDALGRLTQQLTRNGKTGADPVLANTALSRDEIGRVISVVQQIIGSGQSGTRTGTLVYNKRSQVTETTQPGNRKVAFVYDDRGRLTRVDDVQNPGQNKTEYVYNAGSDLVQFIKRFQERNTHSGSTVVDYWTEITYGVGAVITKYRDKGQSGSQTPRDLSIYIDTLGNVDRVVDAAGKEAKMYHDAVGRQVAAARIGQPADVVTRTHFDDADAGGGVTFVRMVDPRGLITKLTYDYLGRQTVVQRPGSDLADPPTAGSPHKPHSLLIQYDAAHRPVQISDGQGVTINQIFDPLNRLLVRESPNVQQALYVSQFVTREVFNRNRLGQITFDLTLRGALGQSMTMVASTGRNWDSLGRIHKESFLYEGAPFVPSDITSAFTGTGDPDFRTDLTYSDGLALQFTPDEIGRTKTIGMKLPGQSSHSTLATYRYMGLAVNERHLVYGSATGQTTFDFDEYGRGKQIKDVVGPTTLAQFDFEYDVINNLVSEKYTRPSTGHVGGGDRFVYDDFNRTAQAWLGLDATSMTAPLDDNDSVYKERSIYNLDPAGNRTSVQKAEKSGGPVAYSTRTYTTEVTPFTSNRYSSSTPGFGDPGPQFYLYDSRGNTTYDGRFYYIHDYNNRLSEVYSVTPGGGQQSQSSSSGPSSQSTTEPVAATIEQLAAARDKILSAQKYDYGRIFRYREELRATGKLKAPLVSGGSSSKKSSSSSSSSSAESSELYLIAIYGYDVHDRRVIRLLVYEGTYFHTYDGWRETEELEVVSISGQNQLVARKAFAWGHRLDELLTYVRRDVNGETVTHTPYYAHQAGGDTTSLLVQGDGTKVENYEYDTFGTPSIYVGSSYSGPSSTVGNPYSWHGKRFDTETGLFYSRYRYYSPDFGRFLNIDPLGIWADLLNVGNGYTYGANAPLNHVDVYGLQSRPSGQELFFAGFRNPSQRCINCHSLSPRDRELAMQEFQAFTNEESITNGFVDATIGLGTGAAEYAADELSFGVYGAGVAVANPTPLGVVLTIAGFIPLVPNGNLFLRNVDDVVEQVGKKTARTTKNCGAKGGKSEANIVEHPSQRAARRAAERQAGMGKHGGRVRLPDEPLRPGSRSPRGDPGTRTSTRSTDTGQTVHHDPYGHKDGNIPPHYGVDGPGGTTHHTYPTNHNPATNR